MKLEKKEKLKEALSKYNLLTPAKYIYRIHYYIRHKRCQSEAKKRRVGKRYPRYSRLLEYKNIHHGERCFIIATGPSLTLEDVEMLKNEYTISMNSIVKFFNQSSWRPTYYGIQDALVYDKLCNDKYFQSIKGKFISDWLQEEKETSPDDIVFPLDLLEHMYINPPKFRTEFSDDAYAIVYDGNTITYSLIQIAVYMGFKEIYLLGCDCDYSGEKKHFVNYGYAPPNDPRENTIIAYKTAKRYADEHNIKIYNATRGGKLEVFERVNLEELSLK